MKKLACVLAAMSLVAASAGAETYSAADQGFGGPVTVTLTVEDGKITEANVAADSETAGIGLDAAPVLAEQLVAAQSAEIDGVAGATFTSNAVKSAAAKALAQANGAEAVTANTYTPGTYEGTARGKNGDVTVVVTFSENAITDIQVKEGHIETPGVSDPAIETMPARILEAQSLDVDTLTGVTMTCSAIISGVADCVKQAGGSTDPLFAATEKTPAADAEYTADIVIVGGGGAGLSAAVAATDAGANVILIEKTGFLGGNSIVSGGIYNCPDPDMQNPVEMTAGIKAMVEAPLAETPVSEEHAALQAKVKEEYDAYLASGNTGLFDSADWFALQTWNGGDKVANLDLVKVLASTAFEDLEWLESMGMQFKDTIGQGVGSLYKRTHSSVMPNGTGFIKTFRDNLATKSNIQIIMETAGESLITDETGAVTGVIAKGKEGNTITLHATKGVILATGGFAGNVEMRVKYCQGEKWPDLGAGLITSNMPAITGDGIVMAQNVGAALVDMDQIQLLQVCNPWTGVTSDVVVGSVDSCIYINKEGNRFVREDGRRDVISAAILAQTDGVMYTIYDSKTIDNPDTFKTLGGRTFTSLEEEGLYGYVHADTLEELAQKLNVPYEALAATMDAYNAHVTAGDASDEFGRELLVNTIDQGPYYAHPRAPAAHHTMGGVKIDTSTHVINENGEIIPGLYAAGEVTGGIHGGNRLGGNAIVDFTVFGKIAGETAAANK